MSMEIDNPAGEIRIGGSPIGGSSVIGCEVLRSSTQSVGSGATVAVPFETATNNADSLWTVGTPDRITAPRAGWYSFAGHAKWQTSAGGRRYASLTAYGSRTITFGQSYKQFESTALSGPVQVVAGNVWLEQNDYVKLNMHQDDTISIVFYSVYLHVIGF